MISTRDMLEASRATSPDPSSTLATFEFEGLIPAPQKVPQKKSLLLSVFPWLTSTVRRHPFLSAFFLYTVLTGFVAGVAKSSYNRDKRGPDANFPYKGNGVAILGYGSLVDTSTGMLSITWSVLGCGEYGVLPYVGPIPYERYPGCYLCDRAVDVYLNDASKPIFSYDPANIAFIPTYYPIYSDTNTFNADHNVGFIVQELVPFDAYAYSASMFVIEKATNKSVPILTFAAGNGPDNVVLSSVEHPTNNAWTYDPGTGPTTVVVESRVVEILMKRSQLAQAFTVCLLLINGALTAGSVYVTLLVMIRKEGVNDGLLLLPVTTILTIPALRALYVGSPQFGIYLDTFGFFSQMMTVAICSMILLYMVATPPAQDRRDSHGNREGYISKMLHRVFPKRSGGAT